MVDEGTGYFLMLILLVIFHSQYRNGVCNDIGLDSVCFDFFQFRWVPIIHLSLSLFTPFENPQRWIGQNTFPILFLNDDNMIGEH